ncbi:MAG: hypothetical protein RLZZ333_2027 [Bacteroidota bacterium]
MNQQIPNKIFKIVVIGPESTGKSTLCQQLSDHFNTNWCREYARDFLLKQGTNYSFDDLLQVAKGQTKAEDAFIQSMQLKEKKLAFIDTDMYVMKVWCPFILNEILQRSYDGYLLCKPDLPWVKDELREYPDLKTRALLYHHYRDILINQTTPWYEVSGEDPGRTEGAIQWVKKLLV